LSVSCQETALRTLNASPIVPASGNFPAADVRQIFGHGRLDGTMIAMRTPAQTRLHSLSSSIASNTNVKYIDPIKVAPCCYFEATSAILSQYSVRETTDGISEVLKIRLIQTTVRTAKGTKKPYLVRGKAIVS
jgi:hypothetical protein